MVLRKIGPAARCTGGNTVRDKEIILCDGQGGGGRDRKMQKVGDELKSENLIQPVSYLQLEPTEDLGRSGNLRKIGTCNNSEEFLCE